MGRRPDGTAARTHLVGVRLSNGGYETITRLAAEDGITLSAMVRTLMSEALAARQKLDTKNAEFLARQRA